MTMYAPRQDCRMTEQKNNSSSDSQNHFAPGPYYKTVVTLYNEDLTKTIDYLDYYDRITIVCDRIINC